MLIIVPSLRAHFCIVVAVTVDCSYAIILMIYRQGKESLLVLDEKAHCSIVLFIKRESKQPNGCFSLRWTQCITASERVNVTPPPFLSALSQPSLSCLLAPLSSLCSLELSLSSLCSLGLSLSSLSALTQLFLSALSLSSLSQPSLSQLSLSAHSQLFFSSLSAAS